MEEVLVVISCFVNVILWLFLFFYFKKRFSTQEYLREIEDEFERLCTEMNGITDRNITLIEDKISTLKELLETADQHIKTVRKEQRKQKKEETEKIKIQEPVNPPETLYAAERYISNLSTVNVVPAQNVPQNISPVTEKQEKPVGDKVLELWKLEMEPERIAAKLSVSLTEIRMIIDMFG